MESQGVRGSAVIYRLGAGARRQTLARFAPPPGRSTRASRSAGKAPTNSEVIKSHVGLLCQGKKDYEAIEAYRGAGFFHRRAGPPPGFMNQTN